MQSQQPPAVPPPPTPPRIPEQTIHTRDQKKLQVWQIVLIVLAALMLLFVTCGYLAYRGAKGYITKMTDTYTDTVALALPPVEVSPADAERVAQEVSAFSSALEEGGTTAPLELTDDDINALIANHPDWENLAGKMHVSIDDGRIRGQVCFPLEEYLPMFKGRYFNGMGIFRVAMTAGRLQVFADSLTVKGEPVPETFMTEFRGKNLAEDFNTDPEYTDVLQRLDSIIVSDDRIRIVARQ